MELSIKPAKGDCGIEAGSEIQVFAWSPHIVDGTSMDWLLHANPDDYEVSDKSSFRRGATAIRVRAPESTKYPLQVTAQLHDDDSCSATFPVVSAHPTNFSVGHESGFEIDGSPKCTRVALRVSDQYGNPISDSVLVDVSLSGAGEILRIDRRNEKTSPSLNGESVFYLDEEALRPHDRYVPKVTILVEGPEIRELNLRTWELEPHKPSHVVIQ